MDIWLKYHVAFLFPSLAPALYAAGTDNYCLARTRDLVVLALRAMREGFRYQGGRETRRQAAGRAREFLRAGLRGARSDLRGGTKASRTGMF
jgi:hypothetical protein